jgi:hypothetical protein
VTFVEHNNRDDCIDKFEAFLQRALEAGYTFYDISLEVRKGDDYMRCRLIGEEVLHDTDI